MGVIEISLWNLTFRRFGDASPVWKMETHRYTHNHVYSQSCTLQKRNSCLVSMYIYNIICIYIYPFQPPVSLPLWPLPHSWVQDVQSKKSTKCNNPNSNGSHINRRGKVTLWRHRSRQSHLSMRPWKIHRIAIVKKKSKPFWVNYNTSP